MNNGSHQSSSVSFAEKQTIQTDGQTVVLETGLRAQYGRFRVSSTLGSGGFADVVLALDPELNRQVALKVPRVGQCPDPKVLEKVITEARTAAGLQHPNIVQVFDVTSDSGVWFIVQEYVCGRTLEHLLTKESCGLIQIVALLELVAEALHHAHERGFIHRDMKPANILVDMVDRPKVSDFGLAVRHSDLIGSTADFAGTVRYMSPEQIRCESHRIDGGSDIWALGVILYRAMTKQFPFDGHSNDEIQKKILYDDPVAPRRTHPDLSEELERICLKCLSRRQAERYQSATELAADLRDWRLSMSGSSEPVSGRPISKIATSDAPLTPRGLRAFGKDDRDFFLRLIPGSRDRDGLPEVLRFWKTGIESNVAESSFRIGLLYGPSGCGKSSLIRAGLLPRISANVRALFVDASQQKPEDAILRSLRKQFPSLHSVERAAEALRQIRDDERLRTGQKFLIVIDQFEHWLQSWDFESNAELIATLRQCDGLCSQCLILVRDDFWLPVSRLMQALEIQIVGGRNSMLIDSFDARHGVSILREFGAAYQCLPAKADDLTEEQQAFLKRVVEMLSQDGRLYPVRIAVFVEMFRRLPWTIESLAGLSSPDDVAISFLNNMFGTAASQSHQSLEPLIRKILAVLLPPSGQIKGPVVPLVQLRNACESEQSASIFEDVIRLLDSELRIITPASHGTDERPSTNQPGQSSSRSVEPGYQLSHDFLVPAIRRYLLDDQRGSRTGRALLLLAEQAEAWHARPSNRLLPSLSEWMTIRFSTSSAQWNNRQKSFMAAADRRVLKQTCLMFAAMALFFMTGFTVWRESELAEQRRTALLAADRVTAGPSGELSNAFEELTPHLPTVVEHLERLTSDHSVAEPVRIRASAALLPLKPEYHTQLIAHLTDPLQPASDFVPLRETLLEHAKDAAEQRLLDMLDETTISDRSRFRVLAALAGFDTAHHILKLRASEVYRFMVREPAADGRIWIEALQPVATLIRDQFVENLQTSSDAENAEVAALAIFEFDGRQTDSLCSIVLRADDTRFRAIMNFLLQHPVEAIPTIRDLMNSPALSTEPSYDRAMLQAKVNAAIALWQLGDHDLIVRLSSHAPDPTLRTLLIESLNARRTSASELLELARESLPERPTLNCALAAFVHHFSDQSADVSMTEWQQLLRELYRNHPDPEVHSLCEVYFRKTGVDLKSLTQDMMELYEPDSKRGWYLNSLDMCMIIVRRENLKKRFPELELSLDHDFAISSTEITRDHFRRMLPKVSFVERDEPSEANLPADGVDVDQAESFCHRLTMQEKMAESDYCYTSTTFRVNGYSRAVADYIVRKGYRLPTDEEWLLATRAWTTTDFWAGTPGVIPASMYAWGMENSGGKSHPVGRLLPNPLGLLDSAGNVFELSFTRAGEIEQYTSRGSTFYSATPYIKSDIFTAMHPGAVGDRHGFRIVRTLP